jgi:hypothetical protein
MVKQYRRIDFLLHDNAIRVPMMDLLDSKCCQLCRHAEFVQSAVVRVYRRAMLARVVLVVHVVSIVFSFDPTLLI